MKKYDFIMKVGFIFVILLLTSFILFHVYADHGVMTIIKEYQNKTLKVKRDGKLLAAFVGDFKTIQDLEMKWTQIDFPCFYDQHLVIIIASNLEYEVTN